MRKLTIGVSVFLLLSFFLHASIQTSSDEKLFREAKILIFDKEWERAQAKLDNLIQEYPHSALYSQALFYKARCLKEQEGREEEALKTYSSYLKQKDVNPSLREQSEVSIIELSYELYKKGKHSFIEEIEKRLTSSNKAVKYYAALKLSHAQKKKIAARSLPVLKEILKKEPDEGLRDRAKIALLRVAPQELNEIREEEFSKEARILKIRVYKKGENEAHLALNIPWALADLALSSFSEEEKALLRKKGYDLDRLMRELSEYKGKIIEIKGDEGIIKIWID